MIRCLVERDAERVDHLRAEDTRVAKGERVRPGALVRTVVTVDGEDVARARVRLQTVLPVGDVAAEDRVVGAQLVIDAPDVLVVVVVERDAVPDLPARVRRGRKLLRHGECRLAERRGVDPVVDERRAQSDLSADVARRRGECREIAREHRRGRRDGVEGRRNLVRHRALMAGEEEQLVANDRAAELVAAESVVDALAVRSHRREVRGRIEAVIAEELEGVAAELVRAGLRHRVHRRRRVHAVVGGQSARRDAELLHRVGERERQIEVVVRVVVHRPVEHVGHAGAETARH